MSEITFDIDLEQDEIQRAIDEYMETRYIEREQSVRRWNRRAYTIALGVFFGLFAVPAGVMMMAGRFEDGLIIFSIITIFVLYGVGLTAFIVWITSRKVRKQEKLRQREDLEKMRYRIEDGFLYRERIGDKRRNRKFDLSKIFYVEKDGYVVSFDYKNETVELLDFYYPPIYDTLKELAGKKGQ